MRTRGWAGFAVVLALGACSTAKGDTVTTLTGVPEPVSNVASIDPGWDDSAVMADLVEQCVAARRRLIGFAGRQDTDLAAGCLDDARVLEAAGCSVEGAIRTLIDPDASRGQCPA